MVKHFNTTTGSACISVQGVQAQIGDGVWVCEDPALESLLSSMGRPSGYFPYPFWRDLAAAERAAELGGMVIWCALPPRDGHVYPPDVVF